MNRYVIIVAGGGGSRMNSIHPKQFMLLGGKPILMYSINTFYESGVKEIIVVIPHSFLEFWKELCLKHSFEIPHKVVAGGHFRTQSVKNGLDEINDANAVVAIHDGVRPFVSKETIQQAFSLAHKTGTAVPYLDLTDSLRLFDGNVGRSVERDHYKSIQTPQCFELSLLKRAYNSSQVQSFKDDASLVEQMNESISMFKGNMENIKITSPLDFIIAEAILKSKESSVK